MRSFTETSEKAANIPLSILPPTAYLWHSIRTLLQSWKSLLTNKELLILYGIIKSLKIYEINNWHIKKHK